MSNEDGKPWVEFRPRNPFILRPAWVDEVGRQGTTYPPTGGDQVKASVNRTPPPPPPPPAGVAALEQEIAANAARTAEIRAELGRIDGEYEAAALAWDVDQDVTARVNMNACADKRRALAHELADLADELPRLQKRLAAAKTAQRHAEHQQDLEQLERALDEMQPVTAEYAQLCIDLVELSQELVQRRNEISRLRRRTNDWADHTGAARCGRDINREAYVPPFHDAWLDGSPRSLVDAKKAMGLD